MIRRHVEPLAHGISLSCRSAGATGPRVMLLHGFPEAAFVWDGVMTALAGEARCLAPNLRGYEASSAPPEVEAYRAKHLVADLVALTERFGAPLDLLVAHDWGGAVAWNLAAQRPDLLRRLLIMNSPHPVPFVRELRDNPAQQTASGYMQFLTRPDAEELLAADDFARLWPFLDSPWRSWTPELRSAYRQVWRYGLTGALNYYRASPLRPPRLGDDAVRHLQFSDDAVTVSCPTTVLWGDADRALLPSLLDDLARWVPKLTIERVADASHWIVHEQPERVVATIRAQLAADD